MNDPSSMSGPRQLFAEREWRVLFLELEALRCVLCAEAAARRGDEASSRVWIEALRLWILRDCNQGN